MKNKDHVSKTSQRWKSLYGNKRLNIPPLDWGERMNEDVKVINRWSCQRGKKAVGGVVTSSLHNAIVPHDTHISLCY